MARRLRNVRIHGNAPPLVIGGCAVVEYAGTAELIFAGHSELFVDGVELGRVPWLAIGEGLRAGEQVLLLHCDEAWNVIGMSAHASVIEAKTRAERLYPGVADAWVQRAISRAEAVAYLDEISRDEKCSFCGRRPDEVARIIQRGDARICDFCVRGCHELLQSDSLEN